MPPLDRALWAWRLGHAARRLRERAARRALSLALRTGLARTLPRGLMARLQFAALAGGREGGFDAGHYLRCNPDVAAAGADPLRHYLRHGWAEGRNPCATLDEAVYRRQAGLAPHDRISALAHRLIAAQGRADPSASAVAQPVDSAGDAPAQGGAAADRMSEAALARLARQPPRDSTGAEVEVIVPVFSGRAQTLRCLASVLEAANRTRFALVVVDDHGPDPRLRADLALLARRGLVERLVPPGNLGFAGAVNLAMARPEGTGRDVIWLNADTEVHGDWIDRLRRIAHDAPDIATVTPLTNNGTICSYPRFDTDNPGPLELDAAALDALAAEVNRGQVVELPTCVGFAAYVRRDALEAIGPLDAQAFGRGYGEENDFSQRAIRAGWRNLAAGEVFVRHFGQCSFGGARAALVKRAMQVMARRHPGYQAAVAAFAAADPMAELRRALDIARLRRLAAGQRRVLVVTHSLGGGTAQHVAEETARLDAGGAGHVVMSGGTGGTDTVRLSHPRAGPLPALESLPIGGADLVSVLGHLGITEVRLHHLADFGRDGARALTWLVDALERPLEVTVHDYMAVCPRINLADGSGMYCGEPGEGACRRCLLRRRSRFGAPDIRRWRTEHGALLAMARLIRVPDRDVEARLRRYFPALRTIVVRPHEAEPQPRAICPEPGRGPLRVAVIGAIGPVKGFDVILGLARAAGPALDLTVIGHTRNDAAAEAAGIRVTGRYRNAEVAGLIAAAAPEAILIPSIWPETYCYALTHALASGRPVAGFDIGAIGTRLRAAAARGIPAHVLPLALARDPQGLQAALWTMARQAEETRLATPA